MLTAIRRLAAAPQSTSRSGAPRAGWPRDVALGGSTALVAALVMVVYWIGGWIDGQPRTETGWTTLAVAAAGLLAGGWLTLGLLGRALSVGEALQHFLVTGLLAASSSSLGVLQPPGNWSELLVLSSFAAAALLAVYHLANAYRLAADGRPLGPLGAALIVALPYAIGLLTLLERPGLLQTLGAWATLGTVTGSPQALETIGRIAVVFLFNEVAVNGIALATRRTLLASPRAHLGLLLAAAAIVAAPWIAAAGSTAELAAWPWAPRVLGLLLTTMLSQAGLWAEVYLITGLLLEAIRNRPPTAPAIAANLRSGAAKAMVYSGVFMALVHGAARAGAVGWARQLAAAHPVLLAAIAGAALFPLAKALIETFDGSQRFFGRVDYAYRDAVLYARGFVAGGGVGLAVWQGLAAQPTGSRSLFGLAVGVAASAGVSLLRDAMGGLTGGGRLQSPRLYLVSALLGGFIGAALGFYFDTAQVELVGSRFVEYAAVTHAPQPFIEYPLLSKWGMVSVGNVTGGVSLLWAQSLAGVISWSIPAWLFALNRTFMAAWFRREMEPVRALFRRDGMVLLVENMVQVLRWGLWMSPIIRSFLRPMGEPTWYNQDGGIHTVLAIVQDLRLSHAAFAHWSLEVFVWLLAFDWVRILIWLDHFGLRVATLVNLSFLGMDRLDQRAARFLAPHATARAIPEGIKRFTTWAPLLIPYYIPRGADWDYAWTAHEALERQAAHGGLLETLAHWPLGGQAALLLGTAVVATGLFRVARGLGQRGRRSSARRCTISNAAYEVVAGPRGDLYSRALGSDFDVSRRAYDLIDPVGRILLLADGDQPADAPDRAWPVMGNYPAELCPRPTLAASGTALQLAHVHCQIQTQLGITLPSPADPVELWTITISNQDNRRRRLWLAPYVEWVLDRRDADRGHTQYNRLFPEMAYAAGLHAVLAWNKHSGTMGFLAAEAVPQGFLTARIDFIGRARSVWRPEALETLAFAPAVETPPAPTLDPIASLLLPVTLEPGGSAELRLLLGLAADKRQALDFIGRYLGLNTEGITPEWPRVASRTILHGTIPPGTPQPYTEFADEGRRLIVHTPLTPRPFDHTLSNALGQVTAVTNRGLHTTSSVNSQQNRLTPDWPDIVTREAPGEAFYLYDVEQHRWYSPTYEPLRDPAAQYTTEYSVDGTATFRMGQDTLRSELTVFVPPEEPATVYLLTLRNDAAAARQIAVTTCFQIVLAAQPEYAGPLQSWQRPELGALFFENPRNEFRTGPAFAAMVPPADDRHTCRGSFLGQGRSPAHPYFAEHGRPDAEGSGDQRPVAALRRVVEVPPGGEATVVVVLGQAADRRRAEAVIRKYRHVAAAHADLEATRHWWRGLIGTVRVHSAEPALDAYLEWLKYQALSERLHARRGFYQASGAFGFRDQLQDAVNLMWMEPRLARRQIVLHAAQQFLEGDVVHWFHLLQDNRTGFVARTHASDNLLWLGWAVVEYLAATGDESLLDEPAGYLEAEQPLPPLPAAKEGMGFDPLRAARAEPIYGHVLRAVDLVLQARMGAHGLPLMGTGDWNDGLDAVGSQGRGESVWLGFFLYYILDRLLNTIRRREGPRRHAHYQGHLRRLAAALEDTWRGDRYLRAIHDDGTEIGLADSGIWEIDALTAAWAVMARIDPGRGRQVFDTALRLLERDDTILLGWPPLREDSRPYLGRSSRYPEGVRENGMYCHGVQWLVGAARILADQCQAAGEPDAAHDYRETAWRLWWKTAAIGHTLPDRIEVYGGQPNQQPADMITSFDPGRMIWNGYTGAAGWMFRQALEGVLGLHLAENRLLEQPAEFPAHAAALGAVQVTRDLSSSPLHARSPSPPGRGLG